MKKIYFLVLPLLLLLGCSKDIFKPEHKRILGTWKITDVKKIGFGGNRGNLPFRSGSFTFQNDGTLTYINEAGDNFKGTWDMNQRRINDESITSLQVTAIDFNNQVVLSEFYDEINFTLSDHFKANITNDFQVYVTHFKK